MEASSSETASATGRVLRRDGAGERQPADRHGPKRHQRESSHRGPHRLSLAGRLPSPLRRMFQQLIEPRLGPAAGAETLEASGETTGPGLFVVAPEYRKLYEDLRRASSAGHGAEVILDRRSEERRQRTERCSSTRSSGARRPPHHHAATGSPRPRRARRRSSRATRRRS
jgi:hypothetical protein